MNQIEHETNGDLIDTTPLFASNLLALYYVLRQNYNERRLRTRQVKSQSPSKKQ